MAIETRVIGLPGQDNNVYIRIDSGQHISHLMFDCGQSGLSYLGKSILQDMDHLFFSHCHMDHISGFDGLFRHVYSRPRPFHIWGPSGIIKIMHCRFQGFTWNLVSGSRGEIIVHEITAKEIISCRFLCREGFVNKYQLQSLPFTGRIIEREYYNIDCAILDHNTDCLGYSVAEPLKININAEILKTQNLSPGKWCSFLKRQDLPKDYEIEIENKKYLLKDLQNLLLETKKGYKVAYITDIIMNDMNRAKIMQLIQDTDEAIMECTYGDEESELAKKNFHLTVNDTATVAHEANVKHLILFHISDRYSKDEFIKILKAAQKIHPDTIFPPHWKMDQ